MAGGGAAKSANRVFTFEDAENSPEASLSVSVPEVRLPLVISGLSSDLGGLTSGQP